MKYWVLALIILSSLSYSRTRHGPRNRPFGSSAMSRSGLNTSEQRKKLPGLEKKSCTFGFKRQKISHGCIYPDIKLMHHSILNQLEEKGYVYSTEANVDYLATLYFPCTPGELLSANLRLRGIYFYLVAQNKLRSDQTPS